ncbi:ORF60 [Anguillid herpesvirus 1]|nr:ORF60 [Anguillid herpesvirus 1]
MSTIAMLKSVARIAELTQGSDPNQSTNNNYRPDLSEEEKKDTIRDLQNEMLRARIEVLARARDKTAAQALDVEAGRKRTKKTKPARKIAATMTINDLPPIDKAKEMQKRLATKPVEPFSGKGHILKEVPKRRLEHEHAERKKLRSYEDLTRSMGMLMLTKPRRSASAWCLV